MSTDETNQDSNETPSQLPLEPNPDLKANDEHQPETPEEHADFDFERMDKDVAEFRQKIQSINPDSAAENHDEFSQFEDDYTPLPRRRRPIRPSEKELDVLESLGAILDRAAPNLDFFLLSILSGLVIGIGYAIDSNAILMFGIFVTPFLGPLVGSVISALIGDQNSYKQTAGAFITGLFLTLVTTSIVGGLSRFMPPNNAIQAYYHSHLWWPDFLLIIIGTILLVTRFVQNESRPIIPALMVAYGLYLPIGVAGFGLGSSLTDLWPQGLFVFLVHLSISTLIAFVIFMFMGVRPKNNTGYLLTGASIIASLLILSYFGGIGNILKGDATPTSQQNEPTAVATVDATLTAAYTNTPHPKPTASKTPTMIPPTMTVAGTPQAIATIAVDQTYGKIQSPTSDGVVIRDSPSGQTITTVTNDHLVQILDDKPVVNDQGTWIHVLVILQTGNIDCWVQSAYIVTETPSTTP